MALVVYDHLRKLKDLSQFQIDHLTPDNLVTANAWVAIIADSVDMSVLYKSSSPSIVDKPALASSDSTSLVADKPALANSSSTSLVVHTPDLASSDSTSLVVHKPALANDSPSLVVHKPALASSGSTSRVVHEPVSSDTAFGTPAKKKKRVVAREASHCSMGSVPASSQADESPEELALRAMMLPDGDWVSSWAVGVSIRNV